VGVAFSGCCLLGYRLRIIVPYATFFKSRTMQTYTKEAYMPNIKC